MKKFFGWGDSKKKSANQALPAQFTISEESILQKLSSIMDPDLNKNIVEAGFVKDLIIDPSKGFVSLRLELTTPACPIKETFKQKSIAVIKEIPGVNQVEVALDAMKPKRLDSKISNPLSLVSNIVAVASGKGGVGKSTSSVYLAYALAKQGAKVGLVDADIYGPSLSKMLGVGRPTSMDGDLIIPPEVHGIKVISGAMFSSPEKAQVLRGPLAANLVKQFLTQVKWGALDYLLIDYPPGTGDIQLTISQIARVDASILVTTPQQVATADVTKAIDMFHTLNVPVAGIIETMSYFSPPELPNKKYRIFGQGGAQRLAKQFGFPLLSAVPIEESVCLKADLGENLLQKDPGNAVSRAYLEAANQLVRQLSTWKNANLMMLGDFQLNWRTK